MTEKEFLDYIWDYGTHVEFIYGNDRIRKDIHPDYKSTLGSRGMTFTINDEEG